MLACQQVNLLYFLPWNLMKHLSYFQKIKKMRNLQLKEVGRIPNALGENNGISPYVRALGQKWMETAVILRIICNYQNIISMSHFSFCNDHCNQENKEKNTQYQMTPRIAFEQFAKHKCPKKHPSNNATHQMSESRDFKRKVSIRQSMEEKTNVKEKNSRLEMSRLSEIHPPGAVEDDQQIRNLLRSMRSRK